MEDFLSRHSEFYRTLAEFPEGTTLNEVLEQAGCTAAQLEVLMQLEQQKEDIYEYAFGDKGLLYKSLKDQDISELLRVAEFLCLSPEIIRKLRIQLGTPETLKMLVPEDVTINFDAPKFWIALGNLEGFKKTFRDNQKGDYCSTAARYGSLECLKWAQSGCPWDKGVCWAAAENGHLECLQWAHQNGYPWDESTCSYAAGYGHIECLQWAHNNGCPWDEWTCSYAADNGHIECLQWAHNNGCPWDEETCSDAAQSGNLEILKWAHQHGCPWNEGTCSSAALFGQLECLQWAHQHGCPWNELTCANAVEFSQIVCLKWAHENGCPWNKKECLADAKTDEIKEWIKNQPE